MRVHLCETRPADKRYCYFRDHVGPFMGHLMHGISVLPPMREDDITVVRINLDEIRGGLDLPDVIGGHLNHLIVRKGCFDVLAAEFTFGPHEVIPIALINKKGRVHSDDYVALNPLGKVECLDTERSEMDNDEDSPSVRIFGKFWLKAAQIPADRDIFRVNGLAIGYAFSDRIVTFIGKKAFTNFVFKDVQLS